MYRQESSLYELYTKALKVTLKKNKVTFKDRYFELQTVLAKSCLCNMVLPLCGFLILIDAFSSGLSLLYLGFSYLPSTLRVLSSTHSHKDKPSHLNKYHLFIAQQ